MADTSAARGLDDDAAVLELGSETLVLTHDTIVEGVHVREADDLDDIAWKLVAVNLSDLAAKGAAPVGVLVSHMLGEDDDGFIAGLEEVLQTYNAPLLGGDTVSAKGRRVWGCTAIGRATATPVPDRRGARPGDAIYVTGTLGRAMLGFEGAAEFAQAYLRPEPLLAAGQALAPLVTAMMDVSDGLLLDADRMARASNTTFALAGSSIPVADASRFADCIRWGDDYQLLFTVAPGTGLPVEATCIGRVHEKSGQSLLLDGTSPGVNRPLGYQH